MSERWKLDYSGRVEAMDSVAEGHGRVMQLAERSKKPRLVEVIRASCSLCAEALVLLWLF